MRAQGEVPDDVITEIGSQNVNCNDSTDEVTEGIEEQGMQAAVMLIEGLEEVDETFLLRAYERKHGFRGRSSRQNAASCGRSRWMI